MSKYRQETFADIAQILERLKLTEVGSSVGDSPRVSVIIPAYNCSQFIGAALETVFAQDYKAFEVIIVNDGSEDTEELRDVLVEYKDRIVYAEQDNLGAACARNSAIALSRGEFLAFLDADDLWLSEFLTSQMMFIDANALDMVYCDALLTGEPLYDGKRFTDSAPSKGEVTTTSLIAATCNVITSGTILRKEVLRNIEMFDTELHVMQDFDLWYRVAKSGAKIGYQDKVLLKYRVEISGLSGSSVERSHRNIEALEVIKDKYGLGEEEAVTWDAQMKVFTAEYELEKGKYFLTLGNFAEAEKYMALANEHFGKFKISMMLFVIRFMPSLAPFLFRTLRPIEYTFIADKE